MILDFWMVGMVGLVFWILYKCLRFWVGLISDGLEVCNIESIDDGFLFFCFFIDFLLIVLIGNVFCWGCFKLVFKVILFCLCLVLEIFLIVGWLFFFLGL